MGSDLAGTFVRHPMHHLGGFYAKPRPMLAGDFVTTESGTGLVHMSPDHGEDDFELCKANGIEPVFAVERDGRYRDDWLWLRRRGRAPAQCHQQTLQRAGRTDLFRSARSGRVALGQRRLQA